MSRIMPRMMAIRLRPNPGFFCSLQLTLGRQGTMGLPYITGKLFIRIQLQRYIETPSMSDTYRVTDTVKPLLKYTLKVWYRAYLWKRQVHSFVVYVEESLGTGYTRKYQVSFREKICQTRILWLYLTWQVYETSCPIYLSSISLSPPFPSSPLSPLPLLPSLGVVSSLKSGCQFRNICCKIQSNAKYRTKYLYANIVTEDQQQLI